ncbi:unnamed protein product [Trichobilharzia regenti]|nr:unnamed protein product [Trichobilharzia regenti]
MLHQKNILQNFHFCFLYFFYRAEKYNPPEGTTPVLNKSIHRVEFDVVTTRVIRDMPAPDVEAMDMS